MTTSSRAPDFVGIGVQKAGTSWWFDLIKQHPRWCASLDAKEYHFFDRFWDAAFGSDDIAAYHALFRREEDEIGGEWTPRYIHDPWSIPLLGQAAPHARILVILRDPIDRYISGLTHSLYADHLPATPLVATDAFTRGLYGIQLERLFRTFERRQVLVLQYERCVNEPADQLARTYGFCGLDPAFRPVAIARRVRETAVPKVPLDEHLRRELQLAYASDLRRLRDVVDLDLDLDLWPTAVATM